jgi:hypothetical protein
MVFGPTSADLPVIAGPLADLMARVGRNIKPRVVKTPRLTDEGLARLCVPILAVSAARMASSTRADAR